MYATFVDILAMRAHFCMKFYTNVKQYNIHFNTKFVETYLKMTNLCCFNHDNPSFLSVLSVVFANPGGLFVALKRASICW